MTCPRCQQAMTRQTVDICLCELSPPAKITHVPAFVCDECGERVFEGEVSIKLDDLRDRFDAPAAYDEVQPMRVYYYDSPLF